MRSGCGFGEDGDDTSRMTAGANEGNAESAPSLTPETGAALRAGTPVEMSSGRIPEPGARPIVRVEELHKSFGRQRVLRGITLSFPRRRTTVVLGPSGCGKSVLLKHIVGLLKPDKGRVWFDDVRVDTLPEHQLGPLRRRFGFLFQLGALFDSMSVCENVRFPLRESPDHDPVQSLQRARQVLRMVGLEESIDKMPSELSGGQQKRVALARAIVLEPQVILYDEPTTGLDPIRADVINELILKLARQLDVTSIIVTHDLAQRVQVADRMVMLHEGHVLLEGTPDEFRRSEDPVVQRFLRGEASDDELAAIRAVPNAITGDAPE